MITLPESLDYGFEIEVDEDGYSVRLPHQCSDWVITGDIDDDFVPKPQALAQLKEFIRQAQACLAELEAHE